MDRYREGEHTNTGKLITSIQREVYICRQIEMDK